jgi:hypothetical protein
MKWQDSKFWKQYLRSRGCTKVVLVNGEVGATGLAMYTGKVQCVGRFAFVRPDSMNYAFVLFTDGTMLDGCFHLFSDGRFSLS